MRKHELVLVKELFLTFCLFLILSPVACGNGGGGGDDANEADVAQEMDASADEADAPTVDTVENGEVTEGGEVAGDGQEEEAAGEEDVSDASAEDALDVVEEETFSSPCPIEDPSTGSIGGFISRGTNMIMDSSNTFFDGIGDIMIAVFDHDPATTAGLSPSALGVVPLADLSSEESGVEFCVQNVPVGDFWLIALLDDDGSGFDTVPDYGDIVNFPSFAGSITASTQVYIDNLTMNVRIGRVHGQIAINPAVAASLSDLTGDLYVVIIDAPTLSPDILGVSVQVGVTLSAESSFPYQVLLIGEPTTTLSGYVTVIFDVNESGVSGGPEPGDLVNFDDSALPPVFPPRFDYRVTGIEVEIDTEIIREIPIH